MLNPIDLETLYEEFNGNLSRWLPDGVNAVNLEFMHTLDLLHANLETEEDILESAHQFYVLETAEKLTLYNQHFVVWIVPRLTETESSTLVLIATNGLPKPHLEMGYQTEGIYNSSKLVLGILNRCLNEIKENQELIGKIENNEKTGT